MKCKNCGTAVQPNEKCCPSCGEATARSACENATDPIETHEENAIYSQPKPKFGGKGIIAVVLALLVIGAGAFFGIRYIAQPDVLDGDTTVATMEGDFSLTNKQLAYYYWDEYFYLTNAYGSQLVSILDPNVPFEQQSYPGTEGGTWYDYFVNTAVDTWSQTMSLASAARAENHVISENYQMNLDSLESDLQTEMTNLGFETMDLLLQDSFGEWSDYDSYVQYLNDVFMASSYANAKYSEIVDAHANDPVEMTDTINVRHILISTEAMTDDADITEAEKTAQLVMDEWLADPTIEKFSALAEEYSSDTYSVPDGGLYINVTPGMMVEEFNDWCFDPARKSGDNAIVKTDFGFHVMLFDGAGEPVAAESNEVVEAEYDAWLSGILESTTYDFTIENVSLLNK